jgi:AAA domain
MQTYFLNQFIEPAQIGIIAPYRAQCSKLRIALKKIAPEIKIGSVEEYQGDVSDNLLRDPFIAEVVYTGTPSHHHHDCPEQPRLHQL